MPSRGLETASAPVTGSCAPRVSHRTADLWIALGPLLAVAFGTGQALQRPSWYLPVTVALYGVMAGILGATRPRRLPGSGLGAANRVTLGRATLVLPVAALVAGRAPLPPAVAWWAVALGAVAMALDGVDGYVARRTGTATRFGARFDMELDAFLLLALSALVWRRGELGPWIILIGALRYLFVAAGWLWPWLRADLPPSRRRKLGCVVQGVALLLCLGPLTATGATATGAAALAFLAISFGLDVWWLATAGRRQAPPAPAAAGRRRRAGAPPGRRSRGATLGGLALLALLSGGCERDEPQADRRPTVETLRAQADGGDADALFALGRRYAHGDGVSRDNVLAYMWFGLAAERLTTEARYEARRMQLVLDGEMFRHQIAEAERLARIWAFEHDRRP